MATPTDSTPAASFKEGKEVPTMTTEVVSGTEKGGNVAIHDAVWGDIDGDGPNYRGLGWVRTAVIMVKYQVGLGVLAMPSYMHTLGLIPGIIVIVVVGLMTTWTDYIVGSFKKAHPEVYTLADVGQIIFGPVGREILFVGYWLYLTFVAGASLLGSSTSLNALSDHAVCTAVFVLIAAIVVAAVASIQTLDRISWITWFGVAGILISVITLTIAVGLRDRPYAAPQTGPWDKGFRLVGDAPFVEVAAAIAGIIFSYAGAPAFFAVCSEMRDAGDFTKSLLWCQSTVIMLYTVIGAVVYHFCGVYLSSPALGSAGGVLKKVCYGFALPGLLISAVLNIHMPAKLLMVRFLRNSHHLASNTKTHYLVWFGCVAFGTTIAYIIAEAIPVFNNLLSLIGAFLATPLAMTIEGMMYAYEAKRKGEKLSWWGWAKHAWNSFIILFSFFAIGTGMWASIVAIRKDVTGGGTVQPFSCADNSGFH